MPAPLDNQTTCRHASLRFGSEQLDIKFRILVDALEDAYYNYWKHGNSKVWEGFNFQETLKDSKVLFDRLHGMLWMLYDIVKHIINTERIDKVDESEYRYDYEDDGITIRVDRIQIARDIINDVRNTDISQILKDGVSRDFGRSFDWNKE